MAEGQIKYSDVFSGDFAPGLEELNQLAKELSKTLLELKDELKDIRSAAASSEKSLKKNNQVLKDSVEVTEDLTKLQQDEVKLKQRLSDATSDQAQANEALKVELAEVNRERKRAAKESKAAEGSMAQLHLRLVRLKKEYRELSQEQRENVQVGGRMLRQIQTMDKQIKKLDASIGNHQRNVGNYTNSIKKAGIQLGKFTKGGLLMMGGALLASTKNLQAASSFMGQLGNTAVVTAGNLQKVAMGQMSIFDAFNMADIWEQARALTATAEASAMLAAQQQKQFADLEYRAEQQKLIRDDEREAMGDRQNANWRLMEVLNDLDRSARDHYERRRREYVEILQNDQNNIAAKTALLNLEAEYLQRLRTTETQRIEAVRQEVALVNQLIQGQEEYDRIVNEAERERYLMRNLSFNQLREFYEKTRNEDVDVINERIKLEERYSAEWKRLVNEREQLYQAHATTMAEIDRQEAQLRLQTAYDVAQSGASIASTLAGENKEIQMATALINTFVGVSQALASAPPPYSFIQAALVLAAGLANVAKIQSTQVPSYAEGVEYLTGKKEGPTKGIFVEAHEGERIVPEQINRHLVGVDNAELPGLIKVGLQVPQLKLSISEMVKEQKRTNELMSGFAWVDKKGNVHYVDPLKVRMYN